jgi:hypothetical protein
MPKKKSELTKEVHKSRLLKVFKARQMLYLSGFITENENGKIYDRILKYQERYRLNISKKDLDQ